MGLMQWFGLSRDPAEAALEARVSSLQTALVKCKEVASRWTRLGREMVAGTAVLFLIVGFTLGVYREPIQQSIANLTGKGGIVRPVEDADAAEAAYQKGNYETAIRIARPLAESGNARAQSLLGRMYSRGRGMPHDEIEAVNWLRRAADQGDPTAEFTLGNLYAEGKGVPQDYVEAARLYRLAAERGDPQSQYNLGLAYAKGEGVAQDNVSAHAWLNIAAARFPASDTINRSLAISSRDAVASKMKPEELAEAQQRAHQWTPK
jgi:TPR repeat protein